MKYFITIVSLLGLVAIGIHGHETGPNTVINNILNAVGPEDPYYPCEGVIDLDECVRDFLSANSICNRRETWDNEPAYTESDLYIHTPIANITVILPKEVTYFANLNGEIQEFYINQNTGNLVISVQFPNLLVESEAIRFVINRRGQEPIVVVDVGRGFYNIVSTVTIPFDPEIPFDRSTLEDSYIYTHQPSYDPATLYFGPNFVSSPDPAIQASYIALGTNIATAFKEFFHSGGREAFLLYLQKYLCNYGITV